MSYTTGACGGASRTTIIEFDRAGGDAAFERCERAELDAFDSSGRYGAPSSPFDASPRSCGSAGLPRPRAPPSDRAPDDVPVGGEFHSHFAAVTRVPRGVYTSFFLRALCARPLTPGMGSRWMSSPGSGSDATEVTEAAWASRRDGSRSEGDEARCPEGLPSIPRSSASVED